MATGARQPRPASPRNRLWLWARRVLVALVGLVLVVLLAGIVFQVVATQLAYRKYPAPGEMVAVDGHATHLYCTGEEGEGPTVVMDTGLGCGMLAWQTVQSEVADFARVCSYDRSGNGWSESGPKPRTSPRIVGELHTLLKNAGLNGPYVLVGHSFGGPTRSSTPPSTRRRWRGWCWSTRRSTFAPSTRICGTPSPKQRRPR